MERHQDIRSAAPLVVVVDDDAAVRNSLKFTLEIDGFAVRTYAAGDELLRTGDLSQCRCLVVDQNMPRMTGLELVDALRQRGVTLPTVLVSGHVTPTMTRLAEGAGVALIEKPFLGNGLIEFIHAAVNRAPD